MTAVDRLTDAQRQQRMPLIVDPLSQAPHPLVGSVLRGTYEVKRLLDRGGMGVLFEAEQLRLRRKVAIKVLPVHLARDEAALLRFQREAELVSSLQHPNIVQIVDYDATELGEPYIVMEFLRGETLETRLSRAPVLPLEFAVRVATQAASGLAAVHEAMIVHRDLKPANIFLSDLPGDGVHVKLLDFGIGRQLTGKQRVTGENDVLGSPDYMPPEQAQGRTAHVDQRGDQYSLAVIVYEMLAGRGPYQGDMMSVLEQVISHEAPRIEDLVPGLPSGIGPVLRRAMAKDRAQRFDTIIEFATALRASSGLAYLSSPPPAPEPDPPEFEDEPERGAAVPSLASLLNALEGARKARSARDVELAALFVERALAIAEALDEAEARIVLEREEALIEGSLEVRVGRRDGRLRVCSNVSAPALRPEEAFLVSRIDGVATVEDVLDLSPLSRVQTLRFMSRLLRERLIAFG